MFQKFYTDTLGGRYIKSLLAQTPIPVFDSVVDGDQIIEGCYYVYKNYIIKCNTSGVLAVDASETLYPSENLYPSVMLFPKIGIRAATFYVKSLVMTDTPKTHSTYISKSNYYDSETHYHLGRYLRYVLTTTGLNLFPFYNSYNGKYLNDVELYMSGPKVCLQRTIKQKYKVVAVPILFGHSYTIAIDCPTQVLMRAAIYDNTGYVEEENIPKSLVSVLQDSGKVYSRLNFKSPVKYRIEVNTLDAVMLQRDLYLVIQLPQANDSSIVVLENYDSSFGTKCDEYGTRIYEGVLNPSLLQMNSKTSYAFSDRLIEYLLNHVVHKDDTIVQNIAKCQTAICTINQDYKQMFLKKDYKKGIWDKELSKQVYNLAEEYSKDHNIYDQDGNLNKDILYVIAMKGGEVQ